MMMTTTNASLRVALISAIPLKIRYFFIYYLCRFGGGYNFRDCHLAFPTIIALILPTTKDVHFNYTFRTKEMITG